MGSPSVTALPARFTAAHASCSRPFPSPCLARSNLCSVGVHRAQELEAMIARLEAAGMPTKDLTDNDLAKDHLRHLVRCLPAAALSSIGAKSHALLLAQHDQSARRPYVRLRGLKRAGSC